MVKKRKGEKVETPKNIARLYFRNRCMLEKEITGIPMKITLSSIQYIDDPTRIPNLKVYQLVFEIFEIKQEKDKTIVNYKFKGITE